MGAERWDEQVGSVADEAGRLLESLRLAAAEAAEQAAGTTGAPSPRPTADGGAEDGADDRPDDRPDEKAARPASGPVPDDEGTHDHDPVTGGAAPHDPVCQWCPICRGAAVVRSLSPETLTRLADLAGVAASVLADLASARAAAADPPDANAPQARRPTPATSRPIPVRDADDPQEAPRG